MKPNILLFLSFLALTTARPNPNCNACKVMNEDCFNNCADGNKLKCVVVCLCKVVREKPYCETDCKGFKCLVKNLPEVLEGI